MFTLLRTYVQDGFTVEEYTKDGINVSHTTKRANSPDDLAVEEIPPQLPPKTLDEKIEEVKQDNLIIMDAMATIFEEILNLQAMQGGGV
jgi:hypothetical protein